MNNGTFRIRHDADHTLDRVALSKLDAEPTTENWNRSEVDVAMRYFSDLELNPSDFDGKDVIDIGCGPRFFKQTILRLTSPKIYINLDIDPSLRNLDIVADAIHLPFRNGSFDLVLAFGSIAGLYWKDYPLCTRFSVMPFEPLLEIARILRSGGTAKIGPISLLRSCWQNETDGTKYELVRHEFVKFATALERQFPNLRVEFYRIVDNKTGRFDEWLTLHKQ